MKKIKVALIFGGKSGEHEVSIVSATSVFKALDKNKYEVTLIGIDKNGRWVLPRDPELLANSKNPREIRLDQEAQGVTLVAYPSTSALISTTGHPIPALSFDVAIPILHGTYGEDGTIQGLLEMAQIPYVGSGVVGSSVGMDKDVSRRLLAHAGIPVVPTVTFHKKPFLRDSKKFIQAAIKELGLPFFVKPANSGSSVGVHKVKTENDALEKFTDAFSLDTKVLVEKSVAAREIEIAVLGNREPRASIVGEIIPNHEFYTYEAKYLDVNGADLKIPAENLSPAQVARVQSLAIQAFQVLELRGLSRIDFFLDKNTQELYLNEVNTMPGFTSISMYPKMWQASGVEYPQLIDELVRLALEHKKERADLRTTYDI